MSNKTLTISGQTLLNYHPSRDFVSNEYSVKYVNDPGDGSLKTV